MCWDDLEQNKSDEKDVEEHNLSHLNSHSIPAVDATASGADPGSSLFSSAVDSVPELGAQVKYGNRGTNVDNTPISSNRLIVPPPLGCRTIENNKYDTIQYDAIQVHTTQVNTNTIQVQVIRIHTSELVVISPAIST